MKFINPLPRDTLKSIHCECSTNIMQFKLRLGIPRLIVPFGEEIAVRMKIDDVDVFLRIWERKSGELDGMISDYYSICEATADIPVNKEISEVVKGLWERRFPKGYDLGKFSDSFRKIYDEDVGIKDRCEPARSQLPVDLQQLILNTYQTLHRSIARQIGLALWRFGQTVPIYFYRLEPMMWSICGVEWRRAPFDSKMDENVPQALFSVNQSIIQEIAQETKDEPLHHELFREAWDHLEKAPRSALVIGIAALEGGTKNLIKCKVPDSGWLVENLPSPPINRIVSDYLPILFPRSDTTQNSEKKAFKNLVNQIKEWNEKRNKLVHGGRAEIRELRSFLLLIRDLLYFFDYLAGEEWASSYVRSETKKSLAQVFAIGDPDSGD